MTGEREDVVARGECGGLLGDLGDEADGDGATMMFWESERGDGLCSGFTDDAGGDGPTGGKLEGRDEGDDAGDADFDLRAREFSDWLCAMVLPSLVLSLSGTNTSALVVPMPEKDLDRGRGFGALGKKPACGVVPSPPPSIAEGACNCCDGDGDGDGAVAIRILLAGTLFGGSSVKDIGTGPTELDSS